MQLFALVESSVAVGLWSTLALVGGAGLVALVSPARFAALASLGGRWYDTDRFFSMFNRRVDVDRAVQPYTRQLGAAVLVAVAVFAWLLTT